MRPTDRWNRRLLSTGASLAVNAAILGVMVRMLSVPSKPAETTIEVELESPSTLTMPVRPPKPRTMVIPSIPPPTPKEAPQPPPEKPRRSILPKLDLSRLFGAPPQEKTEERRVDSTPPRPTHADPAPERSGDGPRVSTPSAGSTGGGVPGGHGDHTASGGGTTGHGPGAPSASGSGNGATAAGGNGGNRSAVSIPTPVSHQPEPRRVEPPKPKPEPPAPKGESRSAQAGRQPKPPYPADARDDGVEGTVLLIAVVGTDGRVDEVKIDKSSGDRRLDRAAEKGVKQWTYSPAMKDGVPVKSSVRVRVEFRLE